jgi:hypothetical protein
MFTDPLVHRRWRKLFNLALVNFFGKTAMSQLIFDHSCCDYFEHAFSFWEQRRYIEKVKVPFTPSTLPTRSTWCLPMQL